MTSASECPCPSCRPSDPSPSYTEAYRLVCEARHVLTWPIQDRRDYLERIEAKNPERATTLRLAMMAQHQAAKGRQ
jgi:hypothetical protein